ncbi:hypothetical protein ACLQ22_15325 [Micromonospora sp. DT178]|uniref:hypothetical protein n=1 Tax=Micromonospora sp. DT178 TaxID=3393436 RepID=UPI003CF20D14
MGAAAREWGRLAELLEPVPTPLTPPAGSPLSERRGRVAELVAARASLPELRAACDELIRAEDQAGRPLAATREFLAVVRYAEGEVAAAREHLERLVEAASAGAGCATPVGAGLLARMILDANANANANANADADADRSRDADAAGDTATDDGGDRDDGGDVASVLAVCHAQLLLADDREDRTDPLVLAQTWGWSVAVMLRVVDERTELRDRVRAALAAQRARGRGIQLTRREVAEIGLQACHAMIGHPTLGALGVAATRRLVDVLDAPEIVARTVRRGAPMWHDG